MERWSSQGPAPECEELICSFRDVLICHPACACARVRSCQRVNKRTEGKKSDKKKREKEEGAVVGQSFRIEAPLLGRVARHHGFSYTQSKQTKECVRYKARDSDPRNFSVAHVFAYLHNDTKTCRMDFSAKVTMTKRLERSTWLEIFMETLPSRS